ncbi:MAG: AMP-binding protein [Fimbriimonadia bacterium]|nr:AMP-binding protein [Fimbriimonadia bacterium]
MKEFDFPIAWQPSPSDIESSNLFQQIKSRGIETYESFLERSWNDPDWFWRAFFEDTGFEWFTDYAMTCDLSQRKPWAQWFAGGQLNWTHNALDRHVKAGFGDHLALVWEGEEGEVKTYTYQQLLEETQQFANGLLALGVQPGDHVGLFLTFAPEVAIALLAVGRIGAIALPLFSGFGPEPIQARMSDAGAKWLIASDGARRRGKPVAMKPVADEALRGSKTLQKVIVVNRIGIETPMTPGRDLTWEAVVELGASQPLEPAPPFPSDHPCLMIYTSGTTGKPKGAVHVHAGFPIKAAQDMFHLFDVKPKDRISWLTDIGWMMGPWLIMGGLTLGATLFMYDGSPDTPAPDRIWEMVDRHQITILGLTPTLIRALMREDEAYADRHPMTSLRLLGSTGEPWNPEPWLWTLQHVGKNRAPILNYSGGTEISGGILGCTALRPLKPCSFNTAVPGVRAEVLNEHGEPVKDEVGFLCVMNSNPGMTRGFWRDPDRYLETYWSRWSDVWDHGDLCLRDENDFWYIVGRADDTLKIAGKRVGPAEIESVLVEHPAVVEAAVIGVPDDLKGQAAVAFVSLKPGNAFSDDLAKELLKLVADRMGKPMMPKQIHAVTDLPKTRNAKIMRRVIRAAYLKEPTGDLTALENPSSVEAIRALS